MHQNEIYIFLDIEATLINGKQHIIEIGAYKWSPNKIIESFEQLVKPSKFKKLNRHIQHLTGITTEELLKAPTFEKVIKDFIAFCGGLDGEKVFVTFGEFDRKVLEEEFLRYKLNTDFLYPIVDYQQKYMIFHQLKNQPSLNSLMQSLNLEVGLQHRALADAESLLKIFIATDGTEVINNQKTDDFIILLGDINQKETVYETKITYLTGKVESKYITINEIHSVNKELLFQVREVEKQSEDDDGKPIIVQVHDILPSDDVKRFLDEIIVQLENKVLITFTGLKTSSKIARIHGSSFPKTETINLKNIFKDENKIEEFKINCHTLKNDLMIENLIGTFQNVIIEEFKKRNLLKKEVKI
ncbi:3'-5' exonuclease [Ureibacillus acetophenoni]|uniref:Inhibitor of KinA sporulation pathway (Predicted exonuclease) n=1 Tax=Ureibacillus acetophenoni TaxID=614649 RepID=A0A285UAD5_9BACL|nr:3'-5' exonuclease [Ureibacillus acetophenoni]SOC37526.1 inhibitor of KinA sporulation pathway (predicted exonuclease) [Ureibacillus acetophenoni]